MVDICFRVNRYVVLPEMGRTGLALPSVLLDHAAWVHEIGHLLLGYRDYYLGSTDLGGYALSARTGLTLPFQASALGYWFFGGWLKARNVGSDQVIGLVSHELSLGDMYRPSTDYLVRGPVGGDLLHHVTFEARRFDQSADEDHRFLIDGNALPPESGVVVFEVNRHLTGSDQIRRLVLERVEGVLLNGRVGAFQPGDQLSYGTDGFSVVAEDFEFLDGDSMEFRIRFPDKLRIARGSNGVELVLDVWPGHDHLIEASTGLGADLWELIAELSLNVGRVQIPFEDFSKQRFFRLRRVPQFGADIR